MAILFQILCHVLGDEDVAGIAAIHHPLRDVDSSSRNVCAATYVHYAADRSAMDPHAQFQLWVFADGTANFQRALHRGFGGVIEDERHTVTSRHGNEPTLCLRRAEMFSLADDLIKHVEQSALLVRYEFGIADNVDKKHIGNLQLDLLLNLLLNLRKHWGRL